MANNAHNDQQDQVGAEIVALSDDARTDAAISITRDGGRLPERGASSTLWTDYTTHCGGNE